MNVVDARLKAIDLFAEGLEQGLQRLPIAAAELLVPLFEDALGEVFELDPHLFAVVLKQSELLPVLVPIRLKMSLQRGLLRGQPIALGAQRGQIPGAVLGAPIQQVAFAEQSGLCQL